MQDSLYLVQHGAAGTEGHCGGNAERAHCRWRCQVKRVGRMDEPIVDQRRAEEYVKSV